ncbi:hypothetical protein BGZ61DRAFT_454352 [Ilyonectria robusta]|uniref:uncharacterized protein n=1 Tax=Ilyonectria robusta TaxID=1079257 RepID=UPI001E8E5091|nr:uncharacterized protein BGZ61DRAFT_454352 [Ilyonectria robusta]KAH8686347.1 hypothetical protein BGZ61DRAFT_454352 [Ilyonectria robusta]
MACCFSHFSVFSVIPWEGRTGDTRILAPGPPRADSKKLTIQLLGQNELQHRLGQAGRVQLISPVSW